MRRSIHPTALRRQGFTVVELLVAMALIVFIMTILSEAFSAGLKTFRDLKAAGDMSERLRSATTVLRSDLLAADHFSRDFIREGLETKVVDPRDVELIKLQ